MKGLIAATLLLMTSANHILGVSHVDNCPVAILVCEKVPKKNYEYLCHVSAPTLPDEGRPVFRWSVSAGKLLDEPTDDTRRVDVQGVKVESVKVEIQATWKKCQSGNYVELKLR